MTKTTRCRGWRRYITLRASTYRENKQDIELQFLAALLETKHKNRAITRHPSYLHFRIDTGVLYFCSCKSPVKVSPSLRINTKRVESKFSTCWRNALEYSRQTLHISLSWRTCRCVIVDRLYGQLRRPGCVYTRAATQKRRRKVGRRKLCVVSGLYPPWFAFEAAAGGLYTVCRWPPLTRLEERAWIKRRVPPALSVLAQTRLARFAIALPWSMLKSSMALVFANIEHGIYRYFLAIWFIDSEEWCSLWWLENKFLRGSQVKYSMVVRSSRLLRVTTTIHA